MRMTGSTILVTGATSGIGRGLAEAFHDLGNQIIITGRDSHLLHEIAEDRPGIATYELDIVDAGAVIDLAEKIERKFPSLNAVFANAGISMPEDVTVDEWGVDRAAQLIDTNIVGTLRTVAAFLPALKRNSESVLLVSSSKLAFLPMAGFPTYCATKAFMHSWLQSIRHQLRHYPIEVLELLPPYVATKLTGTQQLTDPRAMPLDDFIAEVMQLLAEGDHAHGEILVQRAREDRAAEREGRYAEAFARVNPD